MNNFQLNHRKPTSTLVSASYALLLLALLLFGGTAASEIEDITAEGEITVEPVEPLSAEELGDLVAPIALYPDDLLAIVLPAATYPVQVVQAARFLEAREDDATLEPDEAWDDSIIALLNYPEVVTLLNDDLDWTWRLGEAVLIQESDVLAAVSDFRDLARIAGNLESDEHQVVAVDDEGAIAIRLADPKVIYVPYYEPERVIVHQSYPVYHYYPRAYPVYYYPYPAGHRFITGFFWGVISAFSIGWDTHSLHLHHYGFEGHPYYDHSYYDPFYYRRPHLWLSYDYSRHYNHHRNRHHNDRQHRGNQWRPDRQRAGARPRNRHRDYRDWRDERRSDHRQVDRRREHIVADRRSRRAEKREAPERGLRLIASGTARNGVPRTRNVRETTTRRHRQRVKGRRADRTANHEQRATLTTELNREDVEHHRSREVRSESHERLTAREARRQSSGRHSMREVRSQSLERVARVERNTRAPERRVEVRRRTTSALADVRAHLAERARPHQTRQQRARVEAPVVRQARAPAPPATAPEQVHRQSRESGATVRVSNNRAANRHSSGGQRAGREIR
ncbi:MAG: DUF3300 domain-containing protein [Pseudomonadales bacterium]